jgi:hypothetical protein
VGEILSCFNCFSAIVLIRALFSVPKLWNFVDRWVEIPPLAFPKPGRQDFTRIPHDDEIVKLLDLRAKLYIDGYKVNQFIHSSNLFPPKE